MNSLNDDYGMNLLVNQKRVVKCQTEIECKDSIYKESFQILEKCMNMHYTGISSNKNDFLSFLKDRLPGIIDEFIEKSTFPKLN